jgi:hypothetical protein
MSCYKCKDCGHIICDTDECTNCHNIKKKVIKEKLEKDFKKIFNGEYNERKI